MGCDYEVTVIGGGAAGYVAAIQAAQAGKKTCLIEGNKLGGTCLNVGCIPTKVLAKSASLLNEIRRAEQFGIVGGDFSKAEVDMDKLQARKQAVTKQLVGGVASLLQGNHITVVRGRAAFQDEHTVEVDTGKTITSEYFIVATGSETVIAKAIAQEGNCHVLTSTEALELKQVPTSMAVLGGGVIGIEFAYVLSQLGCKVTVLEMMDRILPMVDREISALAQKRLEKAGVAFYLGARVKTLRDDRVIFELDGQERDIQTESVLMSVGRRPSTQGLNAQGIGLEFDRAAIRCDETMRTNLPHIYAVGDVNGKSMLAHTAFHEAETAVKNICGEHAAMRYDRIPSCIYMEPEIACVGLTEEQARERYGDGVKVGRFPALANGKSLVEGDTDGMFKVIVDREYGEILGVHMYGLHVTEMIAQFSAAMEAEATAEEIIHAVQPHPTVSEGLGEAFLSAWKGAAIHNL
ncbi:MAG: dihydrolipoyl dehydrogenase [Lawsonibacter sp.]